jgi:hypothetical protein
MNPLLVLRIGYMERYDGPATITSGGAYVEEYGVGGEVFNFKPSRGKCYGYVMTRHFSGIDLQLIDDMKVWNEGQALAGVDVVFIARKPSVGQVVIGWYRNATVFHKHYGERHGSIPGMDESRRFVCTADATSVHLLSEDERTFEVPFAPAGHKGFPGQSNVWYPKSNEHKAGVTTFTKQLLKYIANHPSAPLGSEAEEWSNLGPNGGRGRNPDHAHNVAVEVAAVDVVSRHYKEAGYKIRSVESENLGWDLVAQKEDQTLHIEVKGVSGSSIYFELTPNEYAKLKMHSNLYRVCVVCDALTSPRMIELSPEQLTDGWRLTSREHGVYIPLKERIAAIGAEEA